VVDNGFASFHYASGLEGWEVFKPETSGFGFGSVEFPRLNNLGRRDTDKGTSVLVLDRVLDTYFGDVTVENGGEEVGTLGEVFPTLFVSGAVFIIEV
jgi:hypothetical protein